MYPLGLIIGPGGNYMYCSEGKKVHICFLAVKGTYMYLKLGKYSFILRFEGSTVLFKVDFNL